MPTDRRRLLCQAGQRKLLDPPNGLLQGEHSRYRCDMHRTNTSSRVPIPNALTATCFLAFTQFAVAQSESPDANTDVLTVRMSEDGVCYFLDDSASCDQLGEYLLTMHLAQNKHIHITVDRASQYDLVAETLKSLDGMGFKVGFVNYDAQASPNEPPQQSEASEPTVPKDGHAIQSHPIHLGEQYYPPESKRLGEQGTCLVRITVTAQGEIRDVTLTKSAGYPRLDQACVDGFKGARMRPAIRDGKPVTLTKEIPVKWTLNEPKPPSPPSK